MTAMLSEIEGLVNPQVLNEISKLDDEKHKSFFAIFRPKTKAAAFILTLLGWHYLYYGKIGTFLLFGITGGGMLIWWLVDLFRWSSLMRKCNDNKSLRVLSGIR